MTAIKFAYSSNKHQFVDSIILELLIMWLIHLIKKLVNYTHSIQIQSVCWNRWDYSKCQKKGSRRRKKCEYENRKPKTKNQKETIAIHNLHLSLHCHFMGKTCIKKKYTCSPINQEDNDWRVLNHQYSNKDKYWSD